jgi:hypothetical protein
MANIYGDYKVLGDLYIQAPDHQPYPLLLSTDSDGKVIFVEAISSITASSPINVINTGGTVSITHETSGWVDKLSLTASTIISNLEVSQEGHLINWETRQLSTNDLFNIGIGLSLDGNTLKLGDGNTLSYVDTPTIKDFFLYQTSPSLVSALYSGFGAVSSTLAEAGFAVTNNANRGGEIKVEYNSASPNPLAKMQINGISGFNILSIDETNGYILRDDIKQRGFVNFGDYENNFIARSLTTKQYVDNRFIRFDINNQGLNNTQKQNARTNIDSVSLNTSENITAFKTFTDGTNSSVIRTDGKILINTTTEISGGGNLQVSGTGNFTNTITASNFITTSDLRIKSDITPIKNALDILDKFISYEYFKNGTKEAGFIAQEIKEVIPYTVFENSDGLLTMSDRPILAYLHSAVLELKNEIYKIKDRL